MLRHLKILDVTRYMPEATKDSCTNRPGAVVSPHKGDVHGIRNHAPLGIKRKPSLGTQAGCHVDALEEGIPCISGCLVVTNPVMHVNFSADKEFAAGMHTGWPQDNHRNSSHDFLISTRAPKSSS